MRLTLTLAALLALGFDSASAQTLDVTEGTRTLRATAYGFDYEFNDGAEQTDQNLSLAGPWSSETTADLDDYYGIHVGLGHATQVSQIGAQSMNFDVDSDASIPGNLFQADSGGLGRFFAQFEVHEPVRFLAVAVVDASVGYNMANASLRNAAGPIFDANADYGGFAYLAEFSWLQPGEYFLEGNAEAQAYGTHGQPDAQNASAQCDFLIARAGDFDLNGTVNASDIYLFFYLWQVKLAYADVDRDGDVDQADWSLFLGYWLAG